MHMRGQPENWMLEGHTNEDFPCAVSWSYQNKQVNIVIFFFIIPQEKADKNRYNVNIRSAKRFAHIAHIRRT